MALREQIWRGLMYLDLSFLLPCPKSCFGCRAEGSKGKGGKLPVMEMQMLPKGLTLLCADPCYLEGVKHLRCCFLS